MDNTIYIPVKQEVILGLIRLLEQAGNCRCPEDFLDISTNFLRYLDIHRHPQTSSDILRHPQT